MAVEYRTGMSPNWWVKMENQESVASYIISEIYSCCPCTSSDLTKSLSAVPLLGPAPVYSIIALDNGLNLGFTVPCLLFISPRLWDTIALLRAAANNQDTAWIKWWRSVELLFSFNGVTFWFPLSCAFIMQARNQGTQGDSCYGETDQEMSRNWRWSRRWTLM